MNSKTTFEVTEKAGAFVAGFRSPGEGKTLTLTEEQAEHALRAGELRRPETRGGQKPAKAKAPIAPETPAE